MKYERLTNKDRHNTRFVRLNKREALKRLWDLENKIENGTLVELPCKSGDTAYMLSGERVIPVRVIITIETICVDKSYGIFWIDEFGKNLFLTQAEAEKKLAELKGDRVPS